MVVSKTERAELAGVVKRRHKLAKAAVDQRRAAVLADFEELLAKQWEPVELAGKELVEIARKAQAEVQRQIEETWRQRGLPEEMMPDSYFGMTGRGSNALAKRRSELRRVATTRAEALALKAKLAIDASEADQLGALAAGGLTSSEAKEFLNAVPQAEDLVPTLTIAELESELPSMRRGDDPHRFVYQRPLDALGEGEW
jgi:hypothetical protein